MKCYNCQTSLPDDARFCRVCGAPVTAFAPPEGFEIDPVSLRYFRNDGVIANTQYTTWFDPDTGEYEQSGVPIEPPPAEPEPTPVIVPVPEPIPAPESISVPEPTPEPIPESVPVPKSIPMQPHVNIPPGFVLDPSSGLYYTPTPGTDPVTGAAGTWYTWFYPDTGEYKQSFNPAAKPVQTRSTAPAGASKPGDGSKGLTLLLILLPIIGLLGGAAFAFIQAGGFALFERGGSEIPPGIEIVTVAEADLPVLMPVTDSSNQPSPDPTDNDADTQPPSSPIPFDIPDEPAEEAERAEAEEAAGS